jgi:hypothetical protein
VRFFVDNTAQAASRVTRARAADHLLTIIYVTRVKLEVDGLCVPLGRKDQPGIQKTQFFEDGTGNSPRYGGDLAPFKPRTDVTLMGSAYVPGGGKTTQLDVTLGVGAWRKSLTIVGDQQWIRYGAEAELTPVQPFAAMSLRMENAFGGIDSSSNPWGKGYGELGTKPGATLAACNINPATERHLRWDREVPASGFGPLPADLPPRLALDGTRDKLWLYKRRPLPPEDFDWGFYNVAPADQQITPYLRGDEQLFLKHFHPRFINFTSDLPRISQRILLRREMAEQAEAQIEEIQAKLDSVHIDTDAMVVDLAWRGVASTVNDKASDVSHCYIAAEQLDEAKPLGWHVAAFKALVDPAVPPPPPPPPPPPEIDPEIAKKQVVQDVQDYIKDLPVPAVLKAAVAAAATPEAVEAALIGEAQRLRQIIAAAVAARRKD